METKNEPKTLEEANYNERETQCCANCEWFNGGHGECEKFNESVGFYGVCDCYE